MRWLPIVALLMGACVEQHPAWLGGGGTEGTGTGTTDGTTTASTTATTLTSTDSDTAATGGTGVGPTTGGTGSTTKTTDPTTGGTTGGSTGGTPEPTVCRPAQGGDEIVMLDSGAGLSLAIPDGGYNGSKQSMVCVALDAASTGVDTVDRVTLEIAMDHEWLGDIVVKVFSPANTVLSVVSRPGVVEAQDNGAGQTSGGTQALLVKESPVCYEDGQPVEAEDMGLGLMGDQAACRDDGVCAYDPSPGSGDGTAFSDFIGESAVGQWEVCFADSGEMDLGTVDRVVLTLVKSM